MSSTCWWVVNRMWTFVFFIKFFEANIFISLSVPFFLCDDLPDGPTWVEWFFVTDTSNFLNFKQGSKEVNKLFQLLRRRHNVKLTSIFCNLFSRQPCLLEYWKRHNPNPCAWKGLVPRICPDLLRPVAHHDLLAVPSLEALSKFWIVDWLRQVANCETINSFIRGLAQWSLSEGFFSLKERDPSFWSHSHYLFRSEGNSTSFWLTELMLAAIRARRFCNSSIQLESDHSSF